MRNDLARLNDSEVVQALKKLVKDERGRLIDILRHLSEMDRRRLADKAGYPSLFEYCVKELRLAEGETARRIHAARAAAKYHVLYGLIGRGLLSVTAVSLLAPHLTHRNHRGIIRSALGRNTRQVEALVASLAPSPNRPDRVKFLGTRADDTAANLPAACLPAKNAPATHLSAAPGQSETSGAAAGGPAPEASAPSFLLPPQRVHFSFTADERLLAAVERAKELLQNKYGAPEFEHVFFEALGALLDKIDPDARTARSRGREGVRPTPEDGERRREVPSWVKRAVWRRDSGRCVFRGEGGRRCGSRAALQYDHVLPWALGGRADDPANIRLLCRAHNALEARRVLGDATIDAAISRRGT